MDVETAIVQGDGLQEVHNGAVEEDQEKQELEVELEGLIRDIRYVEFVESIVKSKKEAVNSEVFDESSDPDFVVPEASKLEKRANDSKDQEEEVKSEEEEESFEDEGGEGDSESSSSDDEGEVEEEESDVAVKIPPEALLENGRRFPPFWRLKQALGQLESDDYDSAADPDFVADEEDESGEEKEEEEEEEDDDAVSGGSADGCVEEEGSSSDECSNSSVSEDKLGEELALLLQEGNKDLSVETEALEQMVEDLTLVDAQEDAAPAAASLDVEKSVTEESSEDGDGETPSDAGVAGLARAFLEHDEEAYKSEEDGNYVPSGDEATSTSDSSSEDEGESSGADTDVEVAAVG